MVIRIAHLRNFGELVLALMALAIYGAGRSTPSLENGRLTVTTNLRDEFYAIRAKGLAQPVIVARVGAEIDHAWVRSNEYPKQHAEDSIFNDELGSGHAIKITFSGLAEKPDLVCVLRLYDQGLYGKH
jgi:alpha-galactosidase